MVHTYVEAVADESGRGVGREEERTRGRFGWGLNLFVGNGGSLLMPWLVLRFPLCYPTRPDLSPLWTPGPRSVSSPCIQTMWCTLPRGHHGNTPPVLCNLSPVHAPYLSRPRASPSIEGEENKNAPANRFFEISRVRNMV